MSHLQRAVGVKSPTLASSLLIFRVLLGVVALFGLPVVDGRTALYSEENLIGRATMDSRCN